MLDFASNLFYILNKKNQNKVPIENIIQFSEYISYFYMYYAFTQ